MKIITPLITTSLFALMLTSTHELQAATSIREKAIQPIKIENGNQNMEILKQSTMIDSTLIEGPITVILHENNDGAKITLPVGAFIQVNLKNQAASTGFIWNPLVSSSDVLAYLDYNIKLPKVMMPGAPSPEYWTFQAITPGTTTLTFDLIRVWEKDLPAQKTIHFDITVE